MAAARGIGFEVEEAIQVPVPGPEVDRTAFRTGLKLGNAAFSLIFSFRTGGRAGFEAIADVVGLVEG
jgi:hypothetical protein